MVEIKRKDKSVVITIDTLVGWTVDFTHERSQKLDAILLRDKINDNFRRRIERIRRDAYNQGWEDKTKRKAKSCWFSSCINEK